MEDTLAMADTFQGSTLPAIIETAGIFLRGCRRKGMQNTERLPGMICPKTSGMGMLSSLPFNTVLEALTRAKIRQEK